MNYQKDLAVKSYCFREFKDAGTLASMVRDCGVNCVDISRCHIDFDSQANQEKLLATLANAGVQIVGLGVVPLSGDIASDRKYYDFCKLVGCDTLSVTFEPANQANVFRVIEQLGGKYGMRCAIHNHGGHHWLGNRTIMQHLFTIAPERLGLCLDTAWALDATENPVDWAKATGRRLFATHLKDFTFNVQGEPADVVLGHGGLDLPAYLQALKAIAFDGPFIIEYEGDSHNPVPALQECVRIVRGLL